MIKPDNEQNFTDVDKEDFLTLGQILRQAREAKKITHEEVAKHLFIHTKIIIALENDDYEEIIATVYARGYVVSYAKFLQLPINEILQKFAEINKLLQDKEPQVQALHEVPRNSRLEKQEYQRILLYVASTILFIAISFGFYNHFKPKATDNLTANNVQSNALDAKVATTAIPANISLDNTNISSNTSANANTPVQNDENKIATTSENNVAENSVNIIHLKPQDNKLEVKIDDKNKNVDTHQTTIDKAPSNITHANKADADNRSQLKKTNAEDDVDDSDEATTE